MLLYRRINVTNQIAIIFKKTFYNENCYTIYNYNCYTVYYYNCYSAFYYNILLY